MQRPARKNGKLIKQGNRPRKNHFWQCPNCGFRIKGNQREVRDTYTVHNCGLEEDRLWQFR
jgi:predicted RNA-binding Zn-ribbon protein involved in translation (DUF1610 family)